MAAHQAPRPWDSPGKNTGVGFHFLLHAWKWRVKVKSLSRVRLLVTPWTAAHQAPPSMGFSGQECWSGVPLPSPGTIPTLLQSCPFFSFLTHTPGKEGWNCGQSYSTRLSYLCIWIMREGSGTKGCWSWIIIDSPRWSFMNSCWWNLGHSLLFTLSFDNSETSIFFHYHPLFIYFFS